MKFDIRPGDVLKAPNGLWVGVDGQGTEEHTSFLILDARPGPLPSCCRFRALLPNGKIGLSGFVPEQHEHEVIRGSGH